MKVSKVLSGSMPLLLVLASLLSAEPLKVGYVLVQSSDAARATSHFGRVQAIRQVDIRSRVSGDLERWLVKEGDLVVKDQVLADQTIWSSGGGLVSGTVPFTLPATPEIDHDH